MKKRSAAWVRYFLQKRENLFAFCFLVLTSISLGALTSSDSDESDWSVKTSLQDLTLKMRMHNWEDLQDIVSLRKIPSPDLVTKSIEKWGDGSPKTVLLIDPLTQWPVKRLGYYEGGQDLFEESDLFTPQSQEGFQDEIMKGVLDGVSILYYSDGSPLRIMTFSKGLPHGIEKQFFSDGSLALSREYNSGNIEGEELIYWPNASGVGVNRLRSKQFYVKGLLEGSSIQYDKNGSKEVEASYKRGLLHGKMISQVKENEPFEEVSLWHVGLLHDDGIKPALTRINSSTGKTIEERHFLLGASHGLHALYHADGSLKMKATYRLGKKEGETSFFNPSGKLIGSGKYLHGKPVGRHTLYDMKGETLLQESIYEQDGKGLHIVYDPLAPSEIKEKYTTLDGDLDGEYVLYSQRSYATHPELSLSFSRGLLDGTQVKKNPKTGASLYEYVFHDGVRDGMQKEWDEKGFEILSTTCKGGFFDGEYKEWYPLSNAKRMKRSVPCRDGEYEGLYQEWFESGKIKVKGDWKNGLEEGAQEEWNEDGVKISSVEFLHGVFNGSFLEWYDDGKPKLTTSYKNGMRQGSYQEWYSNGQLAVKASYSDGNIDGQLTEWYDDGNIAYEGKYKNGLPQGLHVRYFHADEISSNSENGFFSKKPSSQKSIEEMYDSEGLYDGEQRSYYPSGALKAASSYKHGVLDGEKKRYNENGDLIFSARYVKGLLDGKYYQIYPDGMKEERQYNHGLPEGAWTTWAPKEQEEGGPSNQELIILAQATYSNGKIEGEYREYYPSGDISLIVSFRKGARHGSSAIYSPEGKLIASTKYNDGKQDGEMMLYYPSGAVLRRAMFHQNVQEGEDITFYENGSIKSSSVFEKGRLNGPMKEFSQEGVLLFEGSYKDGKRHGIFKKFYPNGALKVELYYKDGQLMKRKDAQSGK